MGLIRMLMFLLAGVAIYVFARRLFAPKHRSTEDPLAGDERLGKLVQDPHCLIYVDINEAVRTKADGVEHYFCSQDCADAYLVKAREEG